MFNVYKNNRHSEETSWRCDNNIELLTVYWTRRDFSFKKKKERKKNSTKPSDGHLHSHFALTQNNLIGRRKKKKKIVSDTPAKTNCSDIRFWSFLRAISDLHVG